MYHLLESDFSSHAKVKSACSMSNERQVFSFGKVATVRHQLQKASPNSSSFQRHFKPCFRAISQRCEYRAHGFFQHSDLIHSTARRGCTGDTFCKRHSIQRDKSLLQSIHVCSFSHVFSFQLCSLRRMKPQRDLQ